MLLAQGLRCKIESRIQGRTDDHHDDDHDDDDDDHHHHDDDNDDEDDGDDDDDELGSFWDDVGFILGSCLKTGGSKC